MSAPKYLIYSSVLFLFIFSNLYAFEVEQGLPDSLSGFRIWDDRGNLIGTRLDFCPSFEFAVHPEEGLAGARESYLIEFKIAKNGLPKRGGFIFGFPKDFDLNKISRVTYHDDSDRGDPTIPAGRCQ